MTETLKKLVKQLKTLPESEQNAFASAWLLELKAEGKWNSSFANQDKLSRLADEAGQEINKKGVEGFFHKAHKEVIDAGHADEIEWQRSVLGKEVSEQQFLSEGAWVILNSGFKEKQISKIWDDYSRCFWDFKDARTIYERQKECRKKALKVFGNKRKADAIIEMASVVSMKGFDAVADEIRADPIENLQAFPMIGPITAQHLAKNLGFPFAKADRHLERIRGKYGFKDVQSMCEHLSKISNEPVPVVDIILWRYSTLRHH